MPEVPYPLSRLSLLRRSALPVVVLALLSGNARAQVTVDTARGLVGKEVVLPFVNAGVSFEGGETLTLHGDFKLTNPTVFFPQVFRGAGVSIVDSSLDRFTDSTYSFDMTMHVERPIFAGDTLFTLAGEALAGSDSVTNLLFSNLSLNDAPLEDFVGVIITRSVGPPFPYIRFAVLDPGRPNPTKPGVTVTWGFRIDKSSDVIFKIYDLIGQEVVVQDLGRLDKGVYINTFTPDFFFPSGMFVVRLMTNSGDAFQIMHVLR